MNRSNDSKPGTLAKLAANQWLVVLIVAVIAASLGLSRGIPARADATSTTFNPSEVTLNVIGVSATITVEAVNLDVAADAIQVKVQHPGTLEVSSPACAGIFTGGTTIPPSTVPGGTGFGCFLIGADVSAATGPVMTFELTRIQDFTTDQKLTLGLGGGDGTRYSNGGSFIGLGATNGLAVKPGPDLTAPRTNVDTFPPNPDDNESATFAFSGIDDVSPPGTLTFDCRLDGGAFAPCTSPHIVGILSEGTHNFEVRSTDEAGNTGSPASYVWSLTLVERAQLPGEEDGSDSSGDGIGGGSGQPGIAQGPTVSVLEVVQNMVPAVGGGVVTTGLGDRVEARIKVPPGALNQNTRITIQAIDHDSIGVPILPESAFSRIFRFGPEGLQFQETVRIVLSYDEVEARGVNEAELEAVALIGGEWVVLGECGSGVGPCLAGRHAVANEILIDTTHFSTYGIQQGVASEAAAPSVVLKDLDDNLIRVFHYDGASGVWAFYDSRPDWTRYNSIVEMVGGSVYLILVAENQTLTVNETQYDLTRGWNRVVWK